MFTSGTIKNEIKQNKQLAKKLHKPIIKKIEKRKVYSSLKGKILGSNTEDVHLISKF